MSSERHLGPRMIGGPSASLNELLRSFPEWCDDATARGLFSPFSQPRNVNPDAFDARMQFWRKVLLESTRRGLLNGSVFVLPDSRSTAERLMRNGLKPLGIARVMRDLIKDNTAEPATLLTQEEQPNVEHIIFRLARLSFNWGWRVLSGSHSGEDEEEPVQRGSNGVSPEADVTFPVVLRPLVKETGDLFLSHFCKRDEHAFFPVVTLEEFQCAVQECRSASSLSAITKLDDFDVLIRYLRSQSAIAVHEDAMVGIVIKVRTIPERSLLVTADECNILRVRQMQKKLSKRVEALSTEVYRVRELAKEAIRKQDKPLAAFELRRSKGLERSREQALAALETIQEIVAKIDSARSSSEIFGAYKAGEQALKSVLASSNFAVEDVDDVMLSLAESMELQEELATALATPIPLTSPASSEPEEVAALEKELEELFMSDASPLPTEAERTPQGLACLPSVPQNEPATKRQAEGDLTGKDENNSLIVE